jgi:hypothetical protein
MKQIFSLGILILFLANIVAEKTITCKVKEIDGYKGCRFSGVTIGPNEAISIETDPANVDPGTIELVEFKSDSIHSVPREVFEKFPNLEKLKAPKQNIQEIKKDTFATAKKLETIHLSDNALTFLHADVFKGNYFKAFYSILKHSIVF